MVLKLRPDVTVAGICPILGGRVKVSGLGEVLMFSRGIKSDHKSCPPKKSTWYVDG